MAETPVFQDKGTLQQFVGQGWTQIGTGTSTIWVLQSNDTNASRIVIMDNVTGSYSVNQAVGADLAYQKATDTFVQWKVTDGTVYGMTFDLQTPASQFTEALGRAVQRLTGIAPAAALPPPVSSSSAGGGLPVPMAGKSDGNAAPAPSGKEKDKKDKEKEKDKKDKDKDKKSDRRRSVKPEKREESSSALPVAIIKESPEEAARRKRREAAREILTSEEAYVKSLMDLVSIWKIPMKTKGILSDSEISILFSNVDTLMQLNTVLVHDLKVRIENWSDSTKIGDVFTKNSIYMKNYKQYYETYNDAQTILAGLPKKKNYSAFAKSAESASGGQPLSQLLALPFQRIPKYLLLLRELINKTPQEHADHPELQDALIQIAAVAAELDKGIADANFAKRLQAVISRNYIGLTPLLVPHRILHMEGELEVTSGGVSKGNVVLVFNDVIAFVIDNAKQKQVVSHIFFDTLWLMPLPPELGANGFELQTPEVTYRCMAKDKASKDQFYEEIDKQVLADLTKKGALADHDVGLASTSERVRTASYTYESGGSYKGEWVNAKMHGKGIRVSSSGSTFEGSFIKGFFHGSGTAIYKTGDIYVGDWARDVPHGKGTLTIKTSLGEKKYEGDWESGRKKGIGTMNWENGDVYEGGWDNDHFHGRGTLSKKDGSRYEGDWNLGARHGHGVYIGPRGDRYEGAWENNMKHGKGSYVAPDGSTYTGDFIADQRQGQGVYVPYEGLRYEGEFIANLYTGQGTLTETGGDLYTGGWRGGKRHGLGTLTRSNGERYEGSWHEDKRHGKGSWINNHGTKYEGEYKDDKKHGQGTITRPDGSSYSGQWAADRRDGSGVERWPNGASYDGLWKTDAMNGQGTFTWPDGSVYTGSWVNGKRCGKGKFKTTAGTYDGDWKDDSRDGQGTWTSSDGSVYTGEWTADRRNGKGVMNNITEQLWRDGLSVKPGIQHLPPDLPAPYYFN